LGGAGATTGVYAPKKIYVMGRTLYDDSNYVYGVNRVYDVSSDSWSDGARMLTPRLRFGVAVVDDMVYVVGGQTEYTGVSALNEVYVPIGYSSVPISALSGLFFKFATVAVLVLIVGTATVIYFKKKRSQQEKSIPQATNIYN